MIEGEKLWYSNQDNPSTSSSSDMTQQHFLSTDRSDQVSRLFWMIRVETAPRLASTQASLVFGKGKGGPGTVGGGLSVMLVNSGWFGLGNKGDLRGLLCFHLFCS